MINGLVSIGKMAEMNRVTVATLRLYDQLGLLTPRYTDPDTGYRYYDIAQNARLYEGAGHEPGGDRRRAAPGGYHAD